MKSFIDSIKCLLEMKHDKRRIVINQLKKWNMSNESLRESGINDINSIEYPVSMEYINELANKYKNCNRDSEQEKTFKYQINTYLNIEILFWEFIELIKHLLFDIPFKDRKVLDKKFCNFYNSKMLSYYRDFFKDFLPMMEEIYLKIFK